jgi:hypothetical protein
MRWLIPAAVVATGLGLLMLYVPMSRGVALIVPPQAPLALVVAGMTGLVVGVIGAWRSRARNGGIPAGKEVKGAGVGASHRPADVAALAGLVVAVAALVAAGAFFFAEPILASLQGPDPCGAAKGYRPPDPACVAAHLDYYQPDPVTGSLSTPTTRLEQDLAPAWSLALVLALGAALISWLALAMGTSRRRTAVSALTLGSFILVGMLGPYLLFLIGGGD